MFHALTTLLSLNIFKVWIFAHLRYLNYSLCYIVALITSVIEHIFISLLAIFSSTELPIHTVDHFFHWICLSGWHMWGSVSTYLSICILQYFLPAWSLLAFAKYTEEFDTHFYFYRLKFVIFFFSIFLCLYKKFSTSIIKIFKIVYEFSNFITFRPLIHLEFIFVYSVCCGSSFCPLILPTQCSQIDWFMLSPLSYIVFSWIEKILKLAFVSDLNILFPWSG